MCDPDRGEIACIACGTVVVLRSFESQSAAKGFFTGISSKKRLEDDVKFHKVPGSQPAKLTEESSPEVKEIVRQPLQKKCVRCNKAYTPTGHRQLVCKRCNRERLRIYKRYRAKWYGLRKAGRLEEAGGKQKVKTAEEMLKMKPLRMCAYTWDLPKTHTRKNRNPWWLANKRKK